MLSPEDRLRIEEEERYRAEVRKQHEKPGLSSVQAVALGLLLGVGGIVALVVNTSGPPQKAGAATVASSGSSPIAALVRPPAPVVRYIPDRITLLEGELTVKPGEHLTKRFEIFDIMNEPRVVGTFNVTGGSENDIVAALLSDDTDIQNFVNGHAYRAHWSSEGKVTAGKLDVRLSPGNYSLIFSNRMSVLSSKRVLGSLQLQFNRRVVE